MSELRKLRLHLEQRDRQLRRVGNVFFTETDASLYVVPFASGGRFLYGQRSFADGETSDTFDAGSQVETADLPKLSLHESGQAHVYAPGAQRVGPVHIPPLRELRGEHVATVQWASAKALRLSAGRMRTSGPSWYVAFGLPDDVPAGALLLYANGREPHFVGEHIHFTLPVASSEGPDVYFGFAAFAKDALGSGAGVTVLGGFNTRLGADESAEYLFVRGS